VTLDLEPIKARAAAAFPGPWKFGEDTAYGMSSIMGPYPTKSVTREWIADADAIVPENGDFIAHAREDVPALIKEVERLRALIGPADGESWTFSLGYSRAPRGLNANDRPDRWAKNASTQQVREEVMHRIRMLGVPVLDRARVDVVWVVASRHHRDTDNLAPFLKAIYDGIGSNRGISARILEDDAPEFMVKPGATIRYEKGGTPRFEVTITDLGGLNA